MLAAAAVLFAAVQWLPDRSESLEAAERGGDDDRRPLARDLVESVQAVEERDGLGPGARSRSSALGDAGPAILAAPADDPDAAHPTLVGRIVGGDGRPLRALVIVGEDVSNGIPLEVDELVRMWDEFETERTSTDPDGRFRFGTELDLSEGFSLFAGAAGHVPLRLDRIPLGAVRDAAGTLDCGDLALQKGLRAQGRVVDRKGNAIPGAEVMLGIVAAEQTFQMDFARRGVPVATTGPDGSFALDCLALGKFTLLVEALGYRSARFTGVASPTGTASATIIVDAGARLEGRLVGRPSSPELALGSLRVEVRPGHPSGESLTDPVARDQGVKSAEIGVDGRFEVLGLLTDVTQTLIVVERRSDGRTLRKLEVAPLEISPGTTKIDVPWCVERSATLRVVDGTTGAPVERFTLSWRAWPAGARPGVDDAEEEPDFQDLTDVDTGIPVRDHADGVVLLTGLGRLTNRIALEVAVAAPGYELHSFTTPSLGDVDVADLGDVRLTRQPELRVHVRWRASGQPVPGAQVFMVDTDDFAVDWLIASKDEPCSTSVSSAITDAQGLARLPSLPGTRVEVSARVAGGLVEKPLIVELSRQGGEELHLQAIGGGSLVATVARPDGSPAKDVTVVCHRVGLDGESTDEWKTIVTDRSGMVTFEHLAPGFYDVATATDDQLHISGAFAWRQHKVVEGGVTRVDLEAPVVGVLRGHIFEAATPLACAMVRLEAPASESVESNDDDYGYGYGYGYNSFYDDLGGLSCMSSTDGSYTLGPVAVGDWDLVIWHLERSIPTRIRVKIRPDENDLDVRLTVTTLEGRLVDADKRPWAGVRIELDDPADGDGGYACAMLMSDSPTGGVEYSNRNGKSSSIATNDDGWFQFRGIPSGRTLSLDSDHDCMEDILRELPAFADGEQRDLGTIVLRTMGWLNVEVQAPNARPSELRITDLARGVELTDKRTALEEGDNDLYWMLLPGRYRVEEFELGAATPLRQMEAEVRVRDTNTVRLP